VADVVDKATRSRMMAGIKGKNTKPEVALRRGLHKLGFRFRLHAKHLPGKPDLVFPKFGSVIFVQGCFWHGHECAVFKWPKSNRQFWKKKIEGNRVRDSKNYKLLKLSGWRVLEVWECQLKGQQSLESSVKSAAGFLKRRLWKVRK
jgi:DNA mismatch endonuclease, patch repair protein